jgi:copper chaperone CopZ
MQRQRLLLLWLLATAPIVVGLLPASAEEPEQSTGTFRMFGLFSRDREADLRQVVEKLPQIKLVSVDFETGEATFAYNVQQAFGTTTPEQIPGRLDAMVRGSSNGTFGVKPRCTIPRDQLQRIEIPVYGLDCKACSYACYRILEAVDGVEYATASFADQKAVVLIDPKRTSREALEKLLKERNVSLEPAKVIPLPS